MNDKIQLGGVAKHGLGLAQRSKHFEQEGIDKKYLEQLYKVFQRGVAKKSRGHRKSQKKRAHRVGRTHVVDKANQILR